MEENPPRVSRSKSNGPTTRRRFATVDDGGGDLIECSGKFCSSCTAGLVADCVALCCCPCALVHCFTLAFVKVPWVVGRRCLGLGSKNKGMLKSKRKCKRGHDDDHGGGGVVERNGQGVLRVGLADISASGFGGVAASASGVGGGGMDSVTVNADSEAEKVWLELYQIGHLDFGRVSSSHD